MLAVDFLLGNPSCTSIFPIQRNARPLGLWRPAMRHPTRLVSPRPHGRAPAIPPGGIPLFWCSQNDDIGISATVFALSLSSASGTRASVPSGSAWSSGRSLAPRLHQSAVLASFIYLARPVAAQCIHLVLATLPRAFAQVGGLSTSDSQSVASTRGSSAASSSAGRWAG